jgi:hypothetical protein
MKDTGLGQWRGIIGLGLVLAVFVPAVAPAQCANNCSGHGTCVPSQKNRRFECECTEGWTGNACSQRVSARAKAKEPPPQELIVEEAKDFEGEALGSRQQGGSARELNEITNLKWAKLSGYEQKLLKDLGWEEATWNTRENARTIWPVAMYKPFDALDRVEQAAVKGFRLTAAQWNAGRHIAMLTAK